MVVYLKLQYSGMEQDVFKLHLEGNSDRMGISPPPASEHLGGVSITVRNKVQLSLIQQDYGNHYLMVFLIKEMEVPATST